MRRVYCKECEYYAVTNPARAAGFRGYSPNKEECRAPMPAFNFKYSYLEKVIEPKDPRIYNSKNTCTYYKSKENFLDKLIGLLKTRFKKK
jgi:hypothetical protein